MYKMKINKIIKNISLLSVICVLILTTFSGCITKEDMKQILENKRLAKNIIKILLMSTIRVQRSKI